MNKNNYGGIRKGAGRFKKNNTIKKKAHSFYIDENTKSLINKYGTGNTFSQKVLSLILKGIEKQCTEKTITFIDLFAGMGGFRIGFEQACKELNIKTECLMTSETKPSAIKALKTNFNHSNFVNDISTIYLKSIPDFDVLLAGFPCQTFSSAGKKEGFLDTRGTLFFEIEKILKYKNPYGFILENVDGLVNHNKKKDEKIGETFKVILNSLNNLGYCVNWTILNSKDFGLAQNRKRVFIIGTKNNYIDLSDFPEYPKVRLKDILEENKETINSEFIKLILSKYSLDELQGKSIQDKRGGVNNIHSWDINLKGYVTKEQKELLNLLLKERRKRKWAEEIGIDWMDGMPLTLNQIKTFYNKNNLKDLLDDLIEKKYIVFEHPKKKVKNEKGADYRIYDETKEKGYNIVTGKLSFEFTKILDNNNITNTLVATEIGHIGVIDNGIRNLTIKEGLRLFGFPEDYILEMDVNSAFDLLGNTVAIPIIKEISIKLLNSIK